MTWRTDTTVAKAYCQFLVAPDGPIFFGKEDSAEFREKVQQLPATTRPFKSDLGVAHYHQADMRDLNPKTKYAYRVGDGTNWSEWSHFETASEQAEPFTFVYFGDAQNDVKSHWSRVVREAFRDAPRAAFFIHAGDLINVGDRDANWGEWYYASGFIHRSIPALPTPGNHEYVKVVAETKPAESKDGEIKTPETKRELTAHWRMQFALPEHGPPGLAETVYRIDYQGVRIISLNSNEYPAEQVPWLREQLKNNPQRWTVVTFHHPIYSTAKGRDNKTIRELWQPVFDEFHVDLVLQGHDHSYGRTDPLTAKQGTALEDAGLEDAGLEDAGLADGAEKNVPTGVVTHDRRGGTVYVVSVSGPKMYAVEQRPVFAKTAANLQLYQIVHVQGDELHYVAKTATGQLYDEFRLTKASK